MLGSTLLILLSLLLVFIAFVAFRKRQNGTASVIAGALVLAALASAGGGASLFHKAYAQDRLTISDPTGEEKRISGDTQNIYTNASGVPMTIGSPVFTASRIAIPFGSIYPMPVTLEPSWRTQITVK